jgi:uncharacterized protein (TIGR02757 family)
MRDFLEEKYHLYNKPTFIETDPISIPRKFSRKQDIEIAGFLAATIAWGQRPTILKNANDILRRMDQSPYDFIRNFERTDLNRFKGFVHRTFNSDDLIFFFKSLQRIYTTYPSLEDLLIKFVPPNSTDLGSAITQWRSEFFLPKHLPRSEKHFSNPATGSACKRINMFLRWMVRKDEYGVDFGIWTKVNPALLTCPLDVHSGRVARKLGLLERKQDDWKAAIELTDRLKAFDPKDPVKYDFALFGLGVFEKF